MPVSMSTKRSGLLRFARERCNLKTFVTEASKEILLKSFRHLYSGAKIEAVYEAGCFGYHLADFLNANDIKTIIVAPHTIPIAPGQFVKTDTIDSRKLAAELAKGNLSGIYLRPREDLFDRGLLSKACTARQTACPVTTSDCSRSPLLRLRLSHYSSGLLVEVASGRA